jgi:hypothetical protein
MKMREGVWLGLQPYFNANSFMMVWVFDDNSIMKTEKGFHCLKPLYF